MIQYEGNLGMVSDGMEDMHKDASGVYLLAGGSLD